jgi:hypothetical protein
MLNVVTQTHGSCSRCLFLSALLSPPLPATNLQHVAQNHDRSAPTVGQVHAPTPNHTCYKVRMRWRCQPCSFLHACTDENTETEYPRQKPA